MGNLREVFTTHLVAEALRARDHEVVHLHSWDDYDRFRKVPAGMDDALEEYVGQPLSAVPDPSGEHDSFASRFIAEFTAALDVLGIRMHQVRQSERYPSGVYNASIRQTMDQREVIFDVLEAQQTPGRQEPPAEERRRRYFPSKPYCEACGKDTTTVAAYADDAVRYRCRCSYQGEMSLADGVTISGSLSGRPTGRCAGPTRVSGSNRPARTITPRPAASPSAASSWRRSTAAGPRTRRCTRSSLWPGRP